MTSQFCRAFLTLSQQLKLKSGDNSLLPGKKVWFENGEKQKKNGFTGKLAHNFPPPPCPKKKVHSFNDLFKYRYNTVTSWKLKLNFKMALGGFHLNSFKMLMSKSGHE